jgi:antitoxin (DNA-binding transcriptional repressor) of toxin-antitoxin stability system
MAETDSKKSKASASRVIDDIEAGASYIVTKQGKSAAALVPIEDAKDLLLANRGEVHSDAASWTSGVP